MTSSDETLLPNGAKATIAGRVGTALDGSASLGGGPEGITTRIGFVCGEFNGGITHRLLTGGLDYLEEQGVDLAHVVVAWAAGAFEFPMVAQTMATSGVVDAVVCLGAVIRGDTSHYDFVAGECAAGIQQVQLATGVPVIFGVLTTDTVDQALVRSRPDETNKGREAVMTALSTVSVMEQIVRSAGPARVGFATGSR
jgi:6,7-dimethyl-8-ribityllumazine synthase